MADAARPPLAVIAIGGNSLITDNTRADVPHQWDAARETAHHIAGLIQAGWRAVITHGNGPQVGYILRRNELAMAEVHTTPIDLIVADTQGAIGYMLQQTLYNEFLTRGIPGHCVTLITQTRVEADDPALQKPTKPIGSFLDEAAARRFEAEGWQVVEDAGRGVWRVTPAPGTDELALAWEWWEGGAVRWVNADLIFAAAPAACTPPGSRPGSESEPSWSRRTPDSFPHGAWRTPMSSGMPKRRCWPRSRTPMSTTS